MIDNNEVTLVKRTKVLEVAREDYFENQLKLAMAVLYEKLQKDGKLPESNIRYFLDGGRENHKANLCE